MIRLRPATADDVPRVVELLVQDSLGKQRETADPLPDTYLQTFAHIETDPHQELMVGDREGWIVGCFQLTFIPYLTYQGSWRALIEGVRVDAAERGQGIGREMMEWAIQRAKERGCRIVQLTTDKRRPDAHRFYLQLGFVASHEGMKLHLT